MYELLMCFPTLPSNSLFRRSISSAASHIHSVCCGCFSFSCEGPRQAAARGTGDYSQCTPNKHSIFLCRSIRPSFLLCASGVLGGGEGKCVVPHFAPLNPITSFRTGWWWEFAHDAKSDEDRVGKVRIKTCCVHTQSTFGLVHYRIMASWAEI